MTEPTSEPAEPRSPTKIATIAALLVISSYVAGKAGRDAILLSQFSIRMLPLFVGLAAASSLPIILLTGKLMARYGPARLIPAMNAISGVMAIGEWLLLARYPETIAVVVFFHLSTASAVLVSGFWSIVNERFDIQTAKKHIGRIGVGATLGGILGGVVAERSAVYFERDAILLVLAVMQLTCAAAMFALGRGIPHRHVQAGEPKAGGIWSSFMSVSRSKLLRGLAAVVILSAVGSGVLDYVFKADIAAGASKETMLRSLAVFYTITNVITAIVQIAVCGPIISKLGVPRSVATLPATVTGFGMLALVFPGFLSNAVTRVAELVTRNSVYRAGYELVYAPLPDDHKRPTKVMLDVGADKLGDILGAQLVGAIVYFAIDPRTGLLIAAVAIGALTLLFALRLPRAYTKALEDSLLTYAADIAADAPPPQPEPWITLRAVPSFGQAVDMVPLSRRPRLPRMAKPPKSGPDPVLALVAELRSSDVKRLEAALAGPVPVGLAPHVIALVGRDDVARAACNKLVTLAPRCTGLLVDTLLDPARETPLRRRLPAILAHGDPMLASWGLWRGLSDPSFEIRSRCGAVLSRLAAEGHVRDINPDQVFEAVRRELEGDVAEWRTRASTRDLIDDDADSHTALAHIFHMLGLILPPEPLRIALHALQAEDASLRGMALEYLETVLPPDVRAQLWPLLDHAEGGAAAALADHAPAELTKRSADELVNELRLSFEKLKRTAG